MFRRIAIFDGHGGSQQVGSNARAVSVLFSTIVYDAYNGISLNCREGTLGVETSMSTTVIAPSMYSDEGTTIGRLGTAGRLHLYVELRVWLVRDN